MDPDEGPLQMERENTDESLRNERTKTDEELGARLRVIEEGTADAVDNARKDADAVIAAFRTTADQRAGSSGGLAPANSTVQKARAAEDARTARERAAADEELHDKRADDITTLLRLLPMEREKTDQHLLTEREQADEAISQRDDFLSIVSHDLRHLLGTITLGASLIEGDARRDAPEGSTLVLAQRILRASARMNRLIGDLLDISSIEAGKLAIAACPCDVTILIQDAVAAFRPAAVAKGLTLDTEGVLPSLPGTLDRDRLFQVLANLIGNAIKFTPPGGQIRVAADRLGADIRLSVRDTGRGIPEDQLEAVFERFWQVGKNDRRGLGLGLYIAKSIVLAQGGAIWAESELGRGSTFHLTLPAAPDRHASPKPPPSPDTAAALR